MMEFLKKRYRKLKKKLKLWSSVNWIKTIYFNFKKFPYSVAKKLPVIFYGKVKFSNISGDVIIEGPITRGMIGFGQRFEKMTKAKGIAEIYIAGKLVFKSNAHFGKDVLLHIDDGAYCEFGYMACLGSSVKLICTNRVVLGDWAGIGYESQIVDTNSHPMMDIETGKYFPMSGPIEIGNYNSFSNRISIMPNTKTPDHCVVASNSLCNKDYTPLGSYILLGGVPAKLIKEKYARDWEGEKSDMLKYKIIKW